MHLPKVLGFIVFFLSLNGFVKGNTIELSENSKVSLLTCGPGTDVADRYGHSAIWILDPINNIDKVYNYGTYDFDTPNFAIKFMKGTLRYHLSIVSFNSFLNSYVNEKRSVIEQVLNLTIEEKQILFEAVEDDYLPENQSYLYDIYDKNCSSLIRDRVFESTSNSFILPKSDRKTTYRTVLQPYIESNTWLQIEINILLGAWADRKANMWDQMYLPDRMKEGFAVAETESGKSLVQSEKVWFSPDINILKRPWWSKSGVYAGIISILLIVLTWWEGKKQIRLFPVDILVLTIAGLIGCIIFFMWFISLHKATSLNMNLIWAHPLLLIVPILLRIRKTKKLALKFVKANAVIILILFLCNVIANLQDISPAGFFFGLAVMARLFLASEKTDTTSG